MSRNLSVGVGEVHSKLTVLRRVGNNYRQQARWECLCECGNTIEVLGMSLKQKHTKSCGCIKILAAGEACFNHLFRNYHNGARGRNLLFELTKEQFRILTKSCCFYCDAEPSRTFRAGRANGNYIYNGIDRKNNNGGYTVENTVACCKTCNFAKLEMSVTDFLAWVDRVHFHQHALKLAA